MAGFGALTQAFSSSLRPSYRASEVATMASEDGASSDFTDDDNSFESEAFPSVEMSRPPSFQPAVPWEFPREGLQLKQRLGVAGTARDYGEMWRARAEGVLGRPGKMTVAVKVAKASRTGTEFRALLGELEIMKLLQPHPNLIQLLGCCTISDPPCILMEYCKNGTLRELLQRQRSAFGTNDLNRVEASPRNISLTMRDLMLFAYHVAGGMEYIADKGLLHHHLSTGKVLLDDQYVCKLRNFGSAKDVADKRQHESKTQNRLPIRWLAPESLFQRQISIESDVWSFGVLIWEIVTLGSTPYPGMNGSEVMSFIQKGCRMPKPKFCSLQLYDIMKDCWCPFSHKRPPFSKLRQRFLTILDDPNNGIFVDQMGENTSVIISPEPPGEKF